MSTFSDTFLAANAANLPTETLPALRQRLEALDEGKSSAVLATELKSPTTALIFSLSLGSFGADRFYLGQIGLGAAKLVLGWATFGIWTIVDWFLIMNATKKVNAEKLNAILATVG